MKDLNEFLEAKQKLQNRLENETITNDLEYEVATFINSLQPYYFYVIKGEEYYFFSILTECFLDQISYENRQEYIRLIYLVAPEELKGEIRKCIKNNSIVVKHFPSEYDFLDSDS